MAHRSLPALCLALAACRAAPPPPLPEVRVHVTVGEPAAAALLGALEARGVARARRVPLAEAELLWLADPTEVVEAGALVAEGQAPALPGIRERFQDPRRRFAPVAARARVLVVAPAPSPPLPFAPVHYRDLADPRLAGRQALAASGGAGALGLAALAVAYGEPSLGRFLALLERARPQRVASDAEARARVAAGTAAVALVSSEEAAAGAASAAGLEVVWPDQDGRGAVILPTAVALTAAGAAAEPARRALAFLTSPEAEQLLVARAPGFLPLREGVLVPVGVRPASSLRALALDWDRLAAEKARLAQQLPGAPGAP